MRRSTLLAASFAAACTLSAHAEAAQISREASVTPADGSTYIMVSGGGPGIYIEGEIQKGDYQKFRSLLQKSEPHINEVTLISPGGNVAEAIKIGELIRQRMLKTSTAFRGDDGVYKLISRESSLRRGGLVSDCVCASACFLIWSAGIERDGNALVLHRPRDVSGSFGAKPAARASQEYSSLLEYMSNYLVRMEVPSRFIDLMVKTPSNASLPLPPVEVQEELEGFPSTIAEWLIADCGAIELTPEEKTHQYALIAKQIRLIPLDEQEERYLAALLHKRENIDQCVWHKLNNERVRLSRESPL